MSHLIENDTFIVGINIVPVINEKYLEGTVFEKKPICCLLCKRPAYGYDEQGKPWCYIPNTHPENVFPIHKKIIQE